MTVVVLAHGSANPAGARVVEAVVVPLLCARGHAAQAAHLLEQVWSAPVRPAHLTGRGRRMAEVVADLAARGLSQPAVMPYLVAPGQFLDRTRAGARSLALEVQADVLGDHPHVAEAVARRYRAAIARRFALSLP